MEILSGILCFLNIVTAVDDFRRRLSSKEDKQALSDFLNDIGTLLLSVSGDLQDGRYPHDKCSTMFEYLTNMKSVLKGKLPEDELEKFQTWIEESYRVEQLLGQLNQLSPEERQYNIDTLRSISGRFVAFSKMTLL